MRPALALLCSIALCAITPVMIPEASAQPLRCVRTYLAQAETPDATLGIAPADALRIVSQFAIANGVTDALPTIVQCAEISKVQAWRAASGYPSTTQGPAVPSGAYIIYDPIWVREVVGNNQTEAAFLFGHELGHHWLHHFDAANDVSQVQLETEADEMGGCAVARLNADFLAMQGLIFRIRSERPDGSYPDQAASLAAATAGFERCGGVRGTGPRFASRTAGPTLLGASLIMETEGFSAQVVQIPGSDGFIGYGHSVTTEEIARGQVQIYGATIDLTQGISEAQAILLLYDDMRRIAEELNRMIEVPLTDPQRAALESFVYNVGIRSFRTSTLRQSINEGRFDEVPRLMARWTRGDGAIRAALQRRRDREIGMWLAGSAPPQDSEPAPAPTSP